MRLAGIVKDSIVDGDGIRDVIFVQGCPHHCVGCHNPQTWSFEGGEEYRFSDIADELEDSPNNITISGGEPFHNAKRLSDLVTYLDMVFPKKTIWIYTGYKFEELPEWLLKYFKYFNVEVIVDGAFEEAKKDTNLRFRGSSNQRLIDFKKTIESGQIVSWEETE